MHKSFVAAFLLAARVVTAQYNVVWDSPSADCHGSMPLGNGDIGLNAWAQTDGKLTYEVTPKKRRDDIVITAQ